MKLTYQAYKLKLKHPFKLAYGTRTDTDIVLVELDHEGHVGYGEASLPPYLSESTKSVGQFLDEIDTERLDPMLFPGTVRYVDGLDDDNNAAKAAVDIALHDLRGKMEGKTLAELMGIDVSKSSASSFTIGMSTLEEMEAKLSDAEDYPMIKLKIGSDDDKMLINRFLDCSIKPFCVDVNQGWNDKEHALEMVYWLTEKGALFVEQPLPVEMVDETAWVTEQSGIPIIADESVKRLGDMAALKGVFNGVNIKLMKSSGIFEALKMIEESRQMGLKVLVGCMAESSCAVTAAASLAPLADWADLDGPALITNDPFDGVKMVNDLLLLPEGPGLGITKVN